MNKTCSLCSLTLPLSSFYTHSTIFDKRVSYFIGCKACTRAARLANEAKLRQSDTIAKSKTLAQARAKCMGVPFVDALPIERKRCHTCSQWLPKAHFFQWQGEMRKRTSRDCRMCVATKAEKNTLTMMKTINVCLEPSVSHKANERQREARYQAVKAWRERNREKSNALDRMYKKKARDKGYLVGWPLIVAHYGSECVRCASPIVICDHVSPLDQSAPERNCLANLQPLCKACNLSKSGLSHDYRHDQGEWIVKSFPDANKPFGMRSRITCNTLST